LLRITYIRAIISQTNLVLDPVNLNNQQDSYYEKSEEIFTTDAQFLDSYLNRIFQFAQFSPKEEIDLALEAQGDNTESLKKLVDGNAKLVVTVAKQYQNQGLSLKDLVSEGNVGLVKAVLKFKNDSGQPFKYYAIWWIRQALLQALAENSRLKRLKSDSPKDIEKLNNVYVYLEEVLNREPTPKELAEASLAHSLSMPHAKLLSALNPIVSNVELESFKLPSEATHPVQSKEMLAFIKANLSSFTEQEKEISTYFFNDDNAVLEEAATHFELGLDETGSIIAKTIRKIRHLKRYNKS